MFTEYHISSNELDNRFIESVKSLYPGKKLSIIVEEEKDETAYLLESEANKSMLLAGLEDVKKGNLIKVKLEDL